MPFGSRAPYAEAPGEQTMRKNLKQNEDFAHWGPTSTAWMHKKQMHIQRAGEWNIARDMRKARKDRLTARLDEEKQISDLTTGRSPQLRGEAGRARAAQRAAEQVFATQ